MTDKYVSDMNPAELRAHMRRLKAMSGWHEPLADALFAEIQRMDGAAPAPSASPSDISQLLVVLGLAGVQVNGGTHGHPWTVKLPSASPDTVGVILEMREQAREARQSDPDAGIFADHAYADLLDEWANRLERHDGRMSGLVRDYIEGMSVSIDVSTGEHDAGNRYYGFVSEVMDDPDDKHGVTLLVQDDVRPNFKVSASPAALTDVRSDAFRDCIDAIKGAIAFGQQDANPPPEGHWLAEFWQIGRKLAASPADQGEDARDAARYRWLRDSGDSPRVLLDGRWYGTQHRACLDLDSAIDAAMSKERGNV